METDMVGLAKKLLQDEGGLPEQIVDLGVEEVLAKVKDKARVEVEKLVTIMLKSLLAAGGRDWG